MTIIGTKWVFKNKLDENGIVSQNKDMLFAQGYNQQEGIDYDETYALVARLESIRILLAYACALDFKLFQMDVKTSFLNGFINEEKQTALAISATEAEYISAGNACQQALWVKQALIDYDVRLNDVLINCDNKGVIDLSNNPVQHSQTKHIKIRHHEELMANMYPDVHRSLKLPVNEHIILEEPLSSSGTLSSMKNLDDAYTFGDQFLNDKSTKDKPGKLNMDSKVVSMVTVPIHQASSSVPPLSTSIIYLSPPKPVPAITHAPMFTATTTPTTTTLPLPPPPPQQSTSDSELEACIVALEEKLAAFEQKTLDASMKRANRDEFLAEKDKSRKRCHEDQDPLPPPSDSDLSDKGKRSTLSISRLKATHYLNFVLEELVTSLWIESERKYDISVTYGISHLWFKRKEFYITRHDAPYDRSKVISYMRILSVISLKTYVRNGYAFLKEIVLRRADYKEYKISKADFKNLYPNDFEDLYLLHLQGFGPARATQLTLGSGLAWSSSMNSCSGRGRDSRVLPGSDPS
nr:copia protein [Tanacetum cinerariifolium]